MPSFVQLCLRYVIMSFYTGNEYVQHVYLISISFYFLIIHISSGEFFSSCHVHLFLYALELNNQVKYGPQLGQDRLKNTKEKASCIFDSTGIDFSGSNRIINKLPQDCSRYLLWIGCPGEILR